MRDYRFPFGNMIFDLYLFTLIIYTSLISHFWIPANWLAKICDRRSSDKTVISTILQSSALGIDGERGRMRTSLTTFNKTFFTFQTYISKGRIQFHTLCIASLCAFVLVSTCIHFRFYQWIFVYFVCIISFHRMETRDWIKSNSSAKENSTKLCNSIESAAIPCRQLGNIVAKMANINARPLISISILLLRAFRGDHCLSSRFLILDKKFSRAIYYDRKSILSTQWMICINYQQNRTPLQFAYFSFRIQCALCQIANEWIFEMLWEQEAQTIHIEMSIIYYAIIM